MDIETTVKELLWRFGAVIIDCFKLNINDKYPSIRFTITGRSYDGQEHALHNSEILVTSANPEQIKLDIGITIARRNLHSDSFDVNVTQKWGSIIATKITIPEIITNFLAAGFVKCDCGLICTTFVVNKSVKCLACA